MNLNLDIDSLPPEQVEAALARLDAIKAQRAVENALAHYEPYPHTHPLADPAETLRPLEARCASPPTEGARQVAPS
jgi:hypothetical protein